MKAITIRLDDETHKAVKVRAASEGVAMEALARVWFDAYAQGGSVVASTETTVRPRGGSFGGGLAAGGETGPSGRAPGGRGEDRSPTANPPLVVNRNADPQGTVVTRSDRPVTPDFKKGKK